MSTPLKKKPGIHDKTKRTKKKIKQTQWPLPPDELMLICGKMMLFMPRQSFKKEIKMDPWPITDVSISAALNKLKERPGTIIVVLDHDETRKYQSLQQFIAIQIPDECARPTIKLVVRNCKERSLPPLFTVGLIGGIGPLADAEVLQRMMQMIKGRPTLENAQFQKRYQIKILSAPPPRTQLETIRKGSAYARFIRHFLRDPEINTFEMTSNTAHSKISLLYMGAKWTNPFTSGNRQIINVVENTVQLIANLRRSDGDIRKQGLTVLIVGTDQAWKASLYQTAFEKNDIDFVDIGLEDYEYDGKKAYKYIEEAIIKIKQAQKGAQEDLLSVLGHIATIDKKMRSGRARVINVVAFTCSEVSIAVKPDDISGIELLREAVVIDTTELMALNMVFELEKQFGIFVEFRRISTGSSSFSANVVQHYTNEYDEYNSYEPINLNTYKDNEYYGIKHYGITHGNHGHNLMHCQSILSMSLFIFMGLFIYIIIWLCGIGTGCIMSKVTSIFSEKFRNKNENNENNDNGQV